MWIFHFIFLLMFRIINSLDGNCPEGAVRSTTSNVCYIFVSTAATFSDAQYYCQAQNGNLVDIDSFTTNKLLGQNAHEKQWDSFWIGATLAPFEVDVGKVKIWTWDGLNKFLSFNDWGFNEPSNKGECAAVTVSNGRWVAEDCEIKKNYVCSIPMQVDVCQPEWMYFAPTKFCYKVLYNSEWNSAENNCILLGGHLVSIHSKEENDFVQDIAQYGFTVDGWDKETWIGLYTTTNDNSIWNWTDGSPLDYPPRWFSGEPNNPGKEKCVLMVTDPAYSVLPGQWGNIECDAQLRNYVCKKNAFQMEIK